MSCCRCVCNSSSAAVFLLFLPLSCPLGKLDWENSILYASREAFIWGKGSSSGDLEHWPERVFWQRFLQGCFWLIPDLWLYLIDGGHWVGYFNLCWGKEKLMLVSKSSLFYFIFFLTRASLRVSYLTAFDSSLKENQAHVVMSSVLSFTATFWNVTLLFIAQPRPCCHLSQELQGAVLCTELSMSL